MLSNTNRKNLAFVMWCIRELEDIKTLFSIIGSHCEINQGIGNPSSVSGAVSGATLLTQREALQHFPPYALSKNSPKSEPTLVEAGMRLEREGASANGKPRKTKL